MNEYRNEHLRRQRAAQEQERIANAQAEARQSRTRTAALFAGIVATTLAMLFVLPMRFQAIAGDDIDPVEQYLAGNVNEDITDAENAIDGHVASIESANDIWSFANSLTSDSMAGMSTTEYVLRMKYLTVDNERVTEQTTIDNLFETDESMDAIITQYENSMPLLDPGEDSPYFVAMVDTADFNDYGTVIDSMFARNDDYANIIDDVIYDKQTGIAYVPKYYYDENAPRPTLVPQGNTETVTVPVDEVPEVAENTIAEDPMPAEPVEEVAVPSDEEKTTEPVKTEVTTETDGEAAAIADDTQQPSENEASPETADVADAADNVTATIENASDTSDTEEDDSDSKDDDSKGTSTEYSGEYVSGVRAAAVDGEGGEANAETETISDEDMELLLNSPEGSVDIEYYDQGIAEEVVPEIAETEAAVDQEVQEIAQEEQVITADDKTSPIQGQLLISYDMLASSKMTIPVTIRSERPGIQTTQITEVTAYSLDTSIVVPVVSEESKDLLTSYDFAIYEGGKDTPILLTDGMGSYDAENGTIVLEMAPMTVASLDITILAEDILTQIVDAATQPETADAAKASNFKAWPGELTKMDKNAFSKAISNKAVYSYKANVGYVGYQPAKWESAMVKAGPYLIAPKDNQGEVYDVAMVNGKLVWRVNNMATKIYDGGSYDAVMGSGVSALTQQGNRKKTTDKWAYGAQYVTGSLTGSFSFPGDKGAGTSATVHGLNFTGLEELEKGYLMGAGSCMHLRRLRPNDGWATQTQVYNQQWNKNGDAVKLRPLLIVTPEKDGVDQGYVVVGFITKAIAYQNFTGVYKFKLKKDDAPVYVKKASTNPAVTDKYPSHFAKNGEGAVYGLYKDRAKAEQGKVQDAYKTFTVKNTGSSDKERVLAGKYYFRELTAPKGYALDSNVYPKDGAFEVKVGQDNVFNAKDQPDFSNWLGIKKKTTTTGIGIGVTTNAKYYAQNGQGAEFGIYEKEADAKAANNNYVKKLTIKADGTTDEYAVKNKADVTYYIRELKAPLGYKKNDNVYSKTVSINQHVQVEIPDDPLVGSITVNKIDAETKKPVKGNFTFVLLDGNGKEIANTSKGTNGGSSVTWDKVAFGAYKVKETTAQYPYMLNGTPVAAEITQNSPKYSTSVTMSDSQHKGTVEIVKTDAQDSNPLENVTFTLTSKQDVTSLDGTKRHTKDQKVTVKATKDAGVYTFDASSKTTEMKSNKAGKVTVKGLYLTTGATSFQFDETATIDGHIINKTPVSVTIPKDESKSEPMAAAKLGNDTNFIDIYKKALKDDQPIAGVTMGMWKSENDATVKADADSDAVMIRTPNNQADYKPTVIRVDDGGLIIAEFPANSTESIRVTKQGGSAADSIVLDAKHPSTAATIESAETEEPTDSEQGDDGISEDDNPSATASTESFLVEKGEQDDPAKSNTSASGSARTLPAGFYTIELLDSTSKVLDTLSDEDSVLGAGNTLHLSYASGKLSAKTTEMGRNATVKWDETVNAWVATDLAPDSKYRIQFGDKTVKVLNTDKTVGTVHYGRYATEESPLFSEGWADQAAMPKSDTNLVTGATISNKQYSYNMVTDAEGHVHVERLPFGKYTLIELRAPVDTTHHKAFLLDTNAHYFTVKDKEGTIADTDDVKTGYHASNAGEYARSKEFVFKDDITKLNITKRSITDSEEIEGALLTLTYENNDVIDEWHSTKEPHYIEGLQPGTYRLIERMTPNNYDQAESITFTLYPTGEIQHVEMFDSPISIDAEIDKRQEIAKPLDERHAENGDGRNRAKVTDNRFGYYDYSIDFRSKSNTWTDEFTVEDSLAAVEDGLARVVSIETPQAWQDYDGKMNVWYKTNLDDDDDDDGDAAPHSATTTATTSNETVIRAFLKDGASQTDIDALKKELEGMADVAKVTLMSSPSSFEIELRPNGAAERVSEIAKTINSSDAFKKVGVTQESGNSILYGTRSFIQQQIDSATGTGSGQSNTSSSSTAETVIRAFVKDGASQADLDALKKELEGMAGVSKVTYMSSPSSFEVVLSPDVVSNKVTDLANKINASETFKKIGVTEESGNSLIYGARSLVQQQINNLTSARTETTEEEDAGESDSSDKNQDGKTTTKTTSGMKNATLSDNHVNPWLSDKDAMEDDDDGDSRIISYDGWKLWEEGLSTTTTKKLMVSDLGLAPNVYITAVRFEYGRVETGFTTRPDEWDRDLLKDYHDDLDDILDVSRRSFDDADAAAESTVKALNNLVDKFTDEASKTAEADLLSRTQAEAAAYEQMLKDIEAYNAGISDESQLPKKFLEAKLVPAFDGDDEDGKKIAEARDAAKLSIQAAFGIDDTPESRLVLRKAGLASLSTLKSQVNETTLNAMTEALLAYESTYLVNDPEGFAAAKTAMTNALCAAIDDIAATGLAGRVHYAPAILHMQVTEAYVPNTTLHNLAYVDAYRNGGGEGLEGHDEDAVFQSAKLRTIHIGTTLKTQDGQKIIERNLDDASSGNGYVTLVDTVSYTGLTPGKLYTMKGELHRRTGRAGDYIDGGAIGSSNGQSGVVSVQFTAEHESGTVDIPFTIKLDDMDSAVVAFEELYINFTPETLSPYTIADHKDINDAGQTVDIVEMASDIIPGSQIFANKKPLAQTGDPVVIIGVLVVTTGTVAAVIVWRRKHSA